MLKVCFSSRDAAAVQKSEGSAHLPERSIFGPSELPNHYYLYGIWAAIKQRCTNPKRKAYKNYGLKGITMHPEWMHNYSSFALWILNNIGPRSDGLTLDRKDNKGNYEPGNLKWSTRSEQETNKSIPFDDRYISWSFDHKKYRLHMPNCIKMDYFDTIEQARIERDKLV